jgi:hypothetical protein
MARRGTGGRNLETAGKTEAKYNVTQLVWFEPHTSIRGLAGCWSQRTPDLLAIK